MSIWIESGTFDVDVPACVAKLTADDVKAACVQIRPSPEIPIIGPEELKMPGEGAAELRNPIPIQPLKLVPFQAPPNGEKTAEMVVRALDVSVKSRLGSRSSAEPAPDGNTATVPLVITDESDNEDAKFVHTKVPPTTVEGDEPIRVPDRLKSSAIITVARAGKAASNPRPRMVAHRAAEKKREMEETT